MSKSLIPWSVGLLLLLSSTPVIGQTDEEIEKVFWQSVECKSARQVQAYFEVYPTGRYLAEAYACLEEQLGLDRAARRLVQQGLTALDYSVGAADGLFGPATRKALREWQAGKGFTATGYLTREQADTLIAQGREAVAEQQRQEEVRRQEKAAQQEQEEARQQTREATSRAQEVPSRIRPDQTCAGQSKGAECWMELANQAGCYVWNGNLQKDETVTWTGECSDGLAHNKGTLVWASDGKKQVLTGPLQGGKWHGDVVIYQADGTVLEGPYVDNKPHGHWTVRRADGTVEEGPAIDGGRYGRWVERRADGTVEEGLYVDGKRRGRWTVRWADGTVEEGPIVDGERHGRWIIRDTNGAVSEVTYVNGERQYQ